MDARRANYSMLVVEDSGGRKKDRFIGFGSEGFRRTYEELINASISEAKNSGEQKKDQFICFGSEGFRPTQGPILRCRRRRIPADVRKIDSSVSVVKYSCGRKKEQLFDLGSGVFLRT